MALAGVMMLGVGWLVGSGAPASHGSRLYHPPLHAAAARLPQQARMAEGVGMQHFIRDLEFLGPVRFVVVGEGAILETVGSFENLRVKQTAKGPLATVSNEDNSFECHIRCNEMKSAQFVHKSGGADAKPMYIIRFLSGNGDSLLSAILHADDGAYEEGAVDFWQEYRKGRRMFVCSVHRGITS